MALVLSAGDECVVTPARVVGGARTSRNPFLELLILFFLKHNNLNFISLHVQAFSGTSLAKEFHMLTATDNAHKAAQPLKRTDAMPVWVLCRSPFRRDNPKGLLHHTTESPLRPRLALLSRHELDQIDCLLDSRGMDRLQMLNTYSQRPDHSRFCDTIAGLLILRLPAEHITFCSRSAGHALSCFK